MKSFIELTAGILAQLWFWTTEVGCLFCMCCTPAASGGRLVEGRGVSGGRLVEGRGVSGGRLV